MPEETNSIIYEGNLEGLPALADNGPYATLEDQDIAKERNVSVAQIRLERYLDDRAS